MTCARFVLAGVCTTLALGCSLNPTLRLAEIAPASEAVELPDVPFHAQEAHHCGPASLLSLLEAAGAEADYQQIVDRVYVPGLEGSLQVEMMAAARSFGYIAYALPGEPSAVIAEVAAGRPVLVLLNLGVLSHPVWHYALVVGFDPRRNDLILHSGQQSHSRQKAGAWLRRWNWAGRWGMVLLKPGEWPASPDRERLLPAVAAFEESAAATDLEPAWRSLLERWPEEPVAWLGLGNALERQGRGGEARSAYRRLLTIDPQSLPARFNLAHSLGDAERACEGASALGAAPPPEHSLADDFADLRLRLDRDCEEASSPAPTTAEVIANASAADWRRLDPENTLYLELDSGRVVIELAPDFAPRHVTNIRRLARQRYWDGLAILRAQENYVVQWGDPVGEDGDGGRSLGGVPDRLPPEFVRSAGDLDFTPSPDGDVYAPQVGWSAGFPVARDTEHAEAWLTHCYGMVGAGRGNAPDSGSGAELYVVIGHSPRHLDRNITLVGRVVQGMELLSTLPRGGGPLGFYEDPVEYVPIRSLRLAADVPERDRTALQLLRTDTSTFSQLVQARRNRREEWFHEPLGRIGVCNVPIPVRIVAPEVAED